MKRLILAFFTTVSLGPWAHAALALQSFSADKHHRYENDPAFIGSGYDWSGVTRSSNTRWVTMISSTYFISANHASPGVGNTVVFHADNDPGGATVSRTVSSVASITGTDIRIGRLDSAPGPTIAIYGIASNTTSGASFSSSPYSDRVAFIVGQNDGTGSVTDFRVGRNELDGFYDAVDVSGTVSDAITFDDDRGTPESLGDDEAFLQGGDSGAPMFVAVGGELVLVGANWFITSGESPNFSGTSFLPNHLAEINAIVTGGGEELTLVSVPEPTAAVFLAIGALSLCRRRR